MAHAIRIHQPGGPEVMQWEEFTPGDPGPGQARVRQTAVGLNYIDTYHRSGLYKLPMPTGLGSEAAGVVEAVGPGVTDIKSGDRVAYSGGAPGAYAEVRVMPVDRLVKLPDGVSERTAATLMLKGLTTQYLIRQTYRVKAGTVGSDEKAEIAKAHGCTHTIVYTHEDYVARVKELTGGKGVPVVYDGVGKAMFPSSLDCLSPRGLYVNFGNASGPVPPLDMLMLSAKGSLYVTRPTLVTYTATRAALLAMAEEMFGLVKSGKIVNDARQTYALKDAGQAHRDLEARKTTGSTLLIP